MRSRRTSKAATLHDRNPDLIEAELHAALCISALADSGMVVLVRAFLDYAAPRLEQLAAPHEEASVPRSSLRVDAPCGFGDETPPPR